MSDKIIHTVIAETAKSLAVAAYELLASADDDFYRLNPSQDAYAHNNWRHFIPFARQSLTHILAKDFSFEIAIGSHTPESVDLMKFEILEALVIDGEFKAPHKPNRQISLLH